MLRVNYVAFTFRGISSRSAIWTQKNKLLLKLRCVGRPYLQLKQMRHSINRLHIKLNQNSRYQRMMRCRVLTKFAYREEEKWCTFNHFAVCWMDGVLCIVGWVCVCASVSIARSTSDYHKKSISVEIFNLTWHDIPFHMCAECTMRTACTRHQIQLCENFQRHRTTFRMYLMAAPAHWNCCVQLLDAWEKKK